MSHLATLIVCYTLAYFVGHALALTHDRLTRPRKEDGR